jgi:alpha,alpha-trehalose-phosphate synthase [UDP-forming]
VTCAAPPPGPVPGRPVTYDLVVLANRLPVDRETDPDGTVRWSPSPGGLVTAMQSVMSAQAGAWVGWSGEAGDPPDPFDEDGMHLHPVGLDRREVEDHYEGFCNETLWPLHHDVIVPPRFRRRWFEAYRTVNRRFADAAARLAEPGATIWVHDYQLQLVPAMLRRLRPDLRIGWFNHIPFPPVELFAQLPWRRDVLEGLLGADLLGFQRKADAENFIRVCRRLLALPTRADTVTVGVGDDERVVRAATFPISIDAHSLDELARTPEVVERSRQIRRDLGGPERLLLGVDRLDYTKGIRHRLKAYSELLADGVLGPPSTVLVQVATPSRERVTAYIELREQVEVTVGRANGDFGRLGQPAIHYLHQSYGRAEMAALFLAADVMLVTPLRDGMNLVAKEYVMCRHDDGGALVLSEFTGSAGELDRAYLCNPHDIAGLKATIRLALDADPQDRRRRMRSMRRRVRERDVHRWAEGFLRSLHAAPERPMGSTAGVGAIQDAAGVLDRGLAAALRSFAGRRPALVALDFDGVLAPLVEDPAAARALPGAMAAVHRLAEVPGITVALVSGRDRRDLLALAGLAPDGRVLAIGSHGAEFDPSCLDDAESDGAGPDGAGPDDAGPDDAALDDAARFRLDEVCSRLQAVADRHPGTHVEVKPTAAVLHTRRAAREVARAATAAALDAVADVADVQVTRGKEVVEVAVLAASKGAAIRRLRRRIGGEAGCAVLYVGDDVTDETALSTLEPGDVGVKVGDGDSAAAYRLADPAAVRELLRALVGLVLT